MSVKKLYSAAALIAALSTAGVQAHEEPAHNDCDLMVFKEDFSKMDGVKVSDDPAGIAFESANDLSMALKDYTMKHGCSLYAIDLQKLIKGLLKGNNIPGAEKQTGGDMHKYIAMDGKKARCAATLGLKLPITSYGVGK